MSSTENQVSKSVFAQCIAVAGARETIDSSSHVDPVGYVTS